MDNFWFNATDVLQVLVLAVSLHYLFRMLRGTRAAQMLMAVVFLFGSIFLVTSLFDLDVLNVLMRGLSILLVGALLVVFQPELRRALATLGQKMYIRMLEGSIQEPPVKILINSIRSLASKRIGALIAIERTVDLNNWVESGIAIDGVVSPELLETIFTPPLPLHDGGVILHGDRIRAARCFFPIDNELEVRGGTRHRAAVTLSDQSDALVLVASEERGTVSVAYDGELRSNVDDRALERYLRAAFVRKEDQKHLFSLVFGSHKKTGWLYQAVLFLKGRERS